MERIEAGSAVLLFFERAPDAPPPQFRPNNFIDPIDKVPSGFGSLGYAYLAALDRDNLKTMRISCVLSTIRWQDGCKQLLQPAAKPYVAAQRSVDTPPAYWCICVGIPAAPTLTDARRRLAYLTAALEPPPAIRNHQL